MARPKKQVDDLPTEGGEFAPVQTTKSKLVQSLTGYCVSPLTGVAYDTTPVEYDERDGWVESQLAAGLFKLVG